MYRKIMGFLEAPVRENEREPFESKDINYRIESHYTIGTAPRAMLIARKSSEKRNRRGRE